jgi:N-acyl-D-aspartate/D-glutamate deacylase
LLTAPSLSESVRHGVTSVLLGGCSLSFIYADFEDCADMFTRVEAFPREILFKLLRDGKSWATPQEWIDHINSLNIGPNVASFIGVVDWVLINGKTAWQDGAFSENFGHERFGGFLAGKHCY